MSGDKNLLALDERHTTLTPAVCPSRTMNLHRETHFDFEDEVRVDLDATPAGGTAKRPTTTAPECLDEHAAPDVQRVEPPGLRGCAAITTR